MVNKINLLRKPSLRYQYFNNGIKSKKIELFYFAITICNTRNKWQNEGHFTTSVPVDPKCFPLKAGFKFKPACALHADREGENMSADASLRVTAGIY
ncbi:MAG: hypothetical protein U9R02_15775 [Thermodesulfobacteriota bacterium]|nr:hypothetical protein [Thermodesulfobacteriota bacterium]